MSVTTSLNPRLGALSAAGTSVWLDQIQRCLVEGGELRRLVEEDSLRGVTSNPAIFEKAILGSDEYDAELVEMAGQGLDAQRIYLGLAVHDVQLAADVLHPVWEAPGGGDGFVSLEVAPALARDTEATLEQARLLWRRVDRRNAMIKIPGTEEGVPAIEQAVYEGINVNVTLLFAVEAYERVAEAYIRGLERRRADGTDLDVHSVASFFVSRVDTKVDTRLEEVGAGHLGGTAALANARAAYGRFKEIFGGERFAVLRAAGGWPQRPLWASTGVKNPRYPETLYVAGLIGPETVNTMPMPTLLAVAERGEVTGPTADQDPGPALDALAAAGIDMAEVTRELLDEGIDAFVAAMDKLLAGVEERRVAQVAARPPPVGSVLPEEVEPALSGRVEKALAEQVAQRVWRRDPTLWGDPATPEIADRLGWLTITEPMLEHAPDLRAFVEGCRGEGLTDAVLLGMGGSSLGAEVIRHSFGPTDGAMRLHVLDSTDPTAVLDLERRLDLERTLFVVSSKSSATIETRSHFRYFFARVRERVGEGAGSRFTAITDLGGPLATLAEENGFRRIFENDPEVGGRYSVLSYFGLVPAALMGVPIEALLHGAQVAEQNSTGFDRGASNSAPWLGVALGELAARGRDKLTFVVSEPVSSFGLWAEQLIAESTGKGGRGIVPVVDEPLGPPEAYGPDRAFAYLRNAENPDPRFERALEALARGGHPVITLSVHGPRDLGRLFFLAEFATAVAGWVLGVNPFDQPNVQEAKDSTQAMLERYESAGALPEVAEADDDALRALLYGGEDGGHGGSRPGQGSGGGLTPPRYLAIMGYLGPSEAFDRAVSDLRAKVRAKTGAATTFGYGPRFLHSTGQLHKGGPRTGVFLQLVHDGDEDADIPDAGYGFGILKNAQALGDLEALRARGLPAERVRLRGDPATAVRRLTDKIEELL